MEWDQCIHETVNGVTWDTCDGEVAGTEGQEGGKTFNRIVAYGTYSMRWKWTNDRAVTI